MARKLKESDTLRSSFPVLNEMIDEVNTFQNQIDQLVIEGDSSVEAAQARVDANGNTFETLKKRLDSKETEFATQLAQNKQEFNQKLSEGLALKANESEVRKKSIKIEPEDVSERFLSLVTGQGTINLRSIPQDGSVNAHSFEKSILSKNLFDKSKIHYGTYVSHIDGTLQPSETRNSSDFIKIDPSKDYYIMSYRNIAFYDERKEKGFISGIEEVGDYTSKIEIPQNAVYLRFSWYTEMIDDNRQMLIEGELPNKYIPYYYSVEDVLLTSENIREDNQIIKTHDIVDLEFRRGTYSTSSGLFRPNEINRACSQVFKVFAGSYLEFTQPIWDELAYLIIVFDENSNSVYRETHDFIMDNKYYFHEDKIISIVVAKRAQAGVEKQLSDDEISLIDNLIQVKMDARDYITLMKETEERNEDLTWQFGTVVSTTGFVEYRPNRIVTDRKHASKGSYITFKRQDNLRYLVAEYDKFGNFVSSGFIQNAKYVFKNDTDYRIVLSYTDDKDFQDLSIADDVIEVVIIGENLGSEYWKKIDFGYQYYWSDITFINDEIWAFQPSDYTSYDEGIGAIHIFDKYMNFKHRLLHDFGHVNTIEYNQETDSLIFGNGSGYYGTDGEIYIIQGVKHWRDLPINTMLYLENLPLGSRLTKIEVFREFGDKINVCWGEDNNNKHNICYVMSNDNQNIRKLLLGKGNAQLEKGEFISGSTAEQFNGTYKILNEWEIPKIDVNQGTCYYNGAIYSAVGHDGLWAVKYQLKSDGTVDITQKHEMYYDDNGNKLNAASEGITVHNGVIYHAVIGVGLFKYKPF